MKPYVEMRNVNTICKTLGLPPTAGPKVKMQVELVQAIRRAIEEQELTHQEAASQAGVGRTVITSVVNGNLHLI